MVHKCGLFGPVADSSRARGERLGQWQVTVGCRSLLAEPVCVVCVCVCVCVCVLGSGGLREVAPLLAIDPAGTRYLRFADPNR